MGEEEEQEKKGRGGKGGEGRGGEEKGLRLTRNSKNTKEKCLQTDRNGAKLVTKEREAELASASRHP